MTLNIETFVLGPIENNTYLLSDPITNEAALIDPAVPSRKIINLIEKNKLALRYIWITHAHFDHIGGVNWFNAQCNDLVDVSLHSDAIDLWEKGGSAREFGFEFDPGPLPGKILFDNEIITLGELEFEVLHTPGHTPGHVTFYNKKNSVAFCGDLIFYHGIGRTDLAISDTAKLMRSISEKIFTLPDDTALFPGHGQPTTVGEEKKNNPFL